MVRNVGTLDRAGRALLSFLLLGYAWNKPGKAGTVAALNAGMLISSVISGYCPLYEQLGLNTVGKPL